MDLGRGFLLKFGGFLLVWVVLTARVQFLEAVYRSLHHHWRELLVWAQIRAYISLSRPFWAWWRRWWLPLACISLSRPFWAWGRWCLQLGEGLGIVLEAHEWSCCQVLEDLRIQRELRTSPLGAYSRVLAFPWEDLIGVFVEAFVPMSSRLFWEVIGLSFHELLLSPEFGRLTR